MAKHALFTAEVVDCRGCGSNEWVVDSRATIHMIHSRTLLTNILKLKRPVQTAVAKTGMYVDGIGTGTFAADFELFNGTVRHVEFANVFLVPETTKNLVSVSSITKKKGEVLFCEKCVKICENVGEAVYGKLKENLFVVEPLTEYSANLSSKFPDNVDLV